MRFKLIQKETIITSARRCVVIRVMAVTDTKDFQKCKMLEKDTVKLQRRTSKKTYETFATAKDLSHAGFILESYISSFTYGEKFVRI